MKPLRSVAVCFWTEQTLEAAMLEHLLWRFEALENGQILSARVTRLDEAGAEKEVVFEYPPSKQTTPAEPSAQ
jgi:hypothetical protein